MVYEIQRHKFVSADSHKPQKSGICNGFMGGYCHTDALLDLLGYLRRWFSDIGYWSNPTATPFLGSLQYFKVDILFALPSINYHNSSEAIVHMIPSLQVLHSKVVFLKASAQLKGKIAENQFGVKFGTQVCAAMCRCGSERCWKSWRNRYTRVEKRLECPMLAGGVMMPLWMKTGFHMCRQPTFVEVALNEKKNKEG